MRPMGGTLGWRVVGRKNLSPSTLHGRSYVRRGLPAPTRGSAVGEFAQPPTEPVGHPGHVARDPQACVPAASSPERQPVAQETWPRRRRRSSRSSIALDTGEAASDGRDLGTARPGSGAQRDRWLRLVLSAAVDVRLPANARSVQVPKGMSRRILLHSREPSRRRRLDQGARVASRP
jgi:hypothetical protein